MDSVCIIRTFLGSMYGSAYVRLIDVNSNIDPGSLVVPFLLFFLSLTDALRGMDHPDFYKVIAQYKFTLAVENGICDDYITEKIWRPWMLGSVPIILGSPKIRVSCFAGLWVVAA